MKLGACKLCRLRWNTESWWNSSLFLRSRRGDSLIGVWVWWMWKAFFFSGLNFYGAGEEGEWNYWISVNHVFDLSLILIGWGLRCWKFFFSILCIELGRRDINGYQVYRNRFPRYGNLQVLKMFGGGSLFWGSSVKLNWKMRKSRINGEESEIWYSVTVLGWITLQ